MPGNPHRVILNQQLFLESLSHTHAHIHTHSLSLSGWQLKAGDISQTYLEAVLRAVSCQGDLLQFDLLNVHHCNMKKKGARSQSSATAAWLRNGKRYLNRDPGSAPCTVPWLGGMPPRCWIGHDGHVLLPSGRGQSSSGWENWLC